MDLNAMCQDPSIAWICGYMSKIFNMQQFPSQNSEINPFNPFNPNPNPQPERPENGIKACNPDRFSNYIGALYDPNSDSFKFKDGSTATLSNREVGGLFRMMGPSTFTTLEFNGKRLNIYYDNASKRSEDPGTITNVRCG
jgi:hypothetical protein